MSSTIIWSIVTEFTVTEPLLPRAGFPIWYVCPPGEQLQTINFVLQSDAQGWCSVQCRCCTCLAHDDVATSLRVEHSVRLNPFAGIHPNTKMLCRVIADLDGEPFSCDSKSRGRDRFTIEDRINGACTSASRLRWCGMWASYYHRLWRQIYNTILR